VKLTYDRKADAIYVTVRAGRVSRTQALDDARTIDFDRAGNVLGYEFLEVSNGIHTRGIPDDVLIYIQRRSPRVPMSERSTERLTPA
jgi:uncharacterized protein YuzE